MVAVCTLDTQPTRLSRVVPVWLADECGAVDAGKFHFYAQGVSQTRRARQASAPSPNRLLTERKLENVAVRDCVSSWGKELGHRNEVTAAFPCALARIRAVQQRGGFNVLPLRPNSYGCGVRRASSWLGRPWFPMTDDQAEVRKDLITSCCRLLLKLKIILLSGYVLKSTTMPAIADAIPDTIAALGRVEVRNRN